jgi:hypothetical protein
MKKINKIAALSSCEGGMFNGRSEGLYGPGHIKPDPGV